MTLTLISIVISTVIIHDLKEAIKIINLTKSLEFFNPVKLNDTALHIIGLGAIGSHVTEQLARIGLDDLVLYDFDDVEDKNIANQIYYAEQIGLLKTSATAQNLKTINPDIKLRTVPKGWTGQSLNGYVFLCVDSIQLRKEIVMHCKTNMFVQGIFDFRMGLTEAQHYAARNTSEEIDRLLKTMEFTQEEAEESMPVSACGTTLSVIPTIKIITALGIANFMNLIKEDKLKHTIHIDAFVPSVLAF